MRIEANRGLEYERRRRQRQQQEQQTYTYWTKTFCNMKNQSNIIAPLKWYENKKNEHTHRISTPYAALRCTIHALYCSYVGGDAHVANTWQTFTLLVRIRCQWRRTALYTCTFYTRDMNILLMSRHHQQPSHTQLMVCSNLCKHNNLAATVLSKTSVKQPEKTRTYWNMEQYLPNRKTSAVKFHRKWREKLILYYENERKREQKSSRRVQFYEEKWRRFLNTPSS